MRIKEEVFIRIDCDGNLFIWKNPGVEKLLDFLGNEINIKEPKPLEGFPFLHLCG